MPPATTTRHSSRASLHIQTTDPKPLQLPSIELLEMKWYLQHDAAGPSLD